MRSVQDAFATKTCDWPGCPSDAEHGDGLCERHHRLQTHGSPAPAPARCDECRRPLTGAHSEACSQFVDQRMPDPPPPVIEEPEMPAEPPPVVVLCKRPDCNEPALERTIEMRSNRYRHLCDAHYEQERAKARATPIPIGLSGQPRPLGWDTPEGGHIPGSEGMVEPPSDHIIPAAQLCGLHAKHEPHDWDQDDDPEMGHVTTYHCDGSGEGEGAQEELEEPAGVLEVVQCPNLEEHDEHEWYTDRMRYQCPGRAEQPERGMGHTYYCALDTDHEGPCRDFAGRNSIERAEQHVTELVTPGAHPRQHGAPELEPEGACLPGCIVIDHDRSDGSPCILRGNARRLEPHEWRDGYLEQGEKTLSVELAGDPHPAQRIAEAWALAIADAYNALASELLEPKENAYPPEKLLDSIRALLEHADLIAGALTSLASAE